VRKVVRLNFTSDGRGTTSLTTSERRSQTLHEYREQLKRTKIENAQQKGKECKKEELEEQHKLDK
jgi:hypothetical protein